MIPTKIKPGMTVRPEWGRDNGQDDMEVQWVGQDENRVLVAGWCPNARSIDGRNTPDPIHTMFSCYNHGKSFTVVKE